MQSSVPSSSSSHSYRSVFFFFFFDTSDLVTDLRSALTARGSSWSHSGLTTGGERQSQK